MIETLKQYIKRKHPLPCSLHKENKFKKSVNFY